MKRIISVCLILALCFSLCACGTSTLKVSRVEEALADFDGTLNIESSGNKVKSFTYAFQSDDILYILDKSYAREGINGVAHNNIGKLTLRHLRVVENYSAVMAILALFESDKSFNEQVFIDKLLDFVCDGRIIRYDGWVVSRDLDLGNNVITIVVAKG